MAVEDEDIAGLTPAATVRTNRVCVFFFFVVLFFLAQFPFSPRKNVPVFLLMVNRCLLTFSCLLTWAPSLT